MINRFSLLALLALGSTSAIAADSYIFEGSLGASQAKDNFGGGPTIDGTGQYLGLTIHSGSVATFDAPLRKAAFIGRANYLQVEQIQMDMDDGFAENKLTSVSGKYLFTTERFITANFATPTGGADIYSIGYGQYFGPTSTGTFSYETNEDTDYDKYSFLLEYAAPYGSDQAWISYDFGASYLQFGDELDGYAAVIGMDYFFTSSMSLGAEYNYLGNENTKINGVEVRGEYFLGRKMSLEAKYQSESVQDFEGDIKVATMMLNFRY